MIELIKAEMAYRKWSYVMMMLMPFVVWALAMFFIQIDESLEADAQYAALFSLASSLLVICMRVPHMIHQTSVEENRIQLLAILPISPRSLAMSQTLPYLIFVSLFSVLGLGVMMVMQVGNVVFPAMLLVNCTLAAIVFGLLSFFIMELLTLLPKWSKMVLWIVCILFPFMLLRMVSETLFGISSYLGQSLGMMTTSIKLVFVGLVFFFGHIVLFTRMRDDFSVRRRYP